MSEKQKDEQPSITYHTFHCRCGWRPDPMSSPDEARALGEKHVESCEEWKAHARKILEPECREEQRIEGVPEGWRLVAFRRPGPGDSYIDIYGSIQKWSGPPWDRVAAVVERISKPKRNVCIAEWDLEEGESISPLGEVGGGNSEFKFVGSRNPDRVRIEDRDA